MADYVARHLAEEAIRRINKLQTIAENLTVVETFVVGDKICHRNNFIAGFCLFFKASNSDVENYSGKNGEYIKMINNETI